MKPKTKIVELVVSDENEALTIDAISLVTSPAIEENFVFFGKEKNNLTLAKVDEEKRELISPALIPNKQIFRYDPNTDSEYYVYFSKETVKQASYLYLKHNNHHKATEQHTDRVSGVLTVESWIKEGEQDKSNLYGFDLPVGTWFVKMKIENDEIWSRIKSGELKGISIEGYFTNKFEQMQKKEFTTEEVRTALKELLSVQKVELGLVDDLIKDSKKLSSRFETAVKNNMQITKLVNENFKELGNLVKAAKKGYGFVNVIDKQISELGIKDPKGYNEAAKIIYEISEGEGEAMLKDLAKFKGLL